MVLYGSFFWLCVAGAGIGWPKDGISKTNARSEVGYARPNTFSESGGKADLLKMTSLFFLFHVEP